MFGKKKKPEPPIKIDVSTWEQDFAFLFLLMERKKKMFTRFTIDAKSSRLSETQRIKDEDIWPESEKTIADIVDSLSDNYKNLLITKYFKDESALISFVAEDFLLFVTETVLSVNNVKAINMITDSILKKIEVGK